MTHTTETVLAWGVNGEPIPHSLAEFTNRLYGAALSIPAEYRETAQIDLDPLYEYGESYPQVRVTYQRPMTAAEIEAHAAEETSRLAESLRQAEGRVEFLRAKVGGQP